MAVGLDTITAPFTGAPYTGYAAPAQRDYLSTQFNTGLSAANPTPTLAALQSARDIAAPAVAAGFNTARQDVLGGISDATKSLYGGQTAGVGVLTGAQDPAIAALQGGTGAGIDAWKQLLTDTGSSNPSTASALADALGLNGPEGTARAQAQLTGSSPYQYGLTTGLDALTRNANTGGMVAGGNLLTESQKFGQDYGQQYAQQNITNLMNRLGQQSQVGTAAAGGIAGAAGTGGAGEAAIRTGTAGQLANLYSGTGANVANLQLSGAGTLGGLASQGGLAVGGLYTDEAAKEAAARAGYAGNVNDLIKTISSPYASTYGAEAAATTNAGSNILNAGLAGLKAGAGFFR